MQLGCCSSHASNALKCRVKQYHSVRHAARFIFPLLKSYKSLLCTPRRERLESMLIGLPDSLAHEGPLNYMHLNAFAEICEGSLLPMFGGRCSENKQTLSPSAHVLEMWKPHLQEVYKEAVAKLSHSETGKARPQRFEAGLAAKKVFVAERDECNVCFQCENAVEDTLSRRWSELIDRYSLVLPDRSPLHELENLPQEIGIGELLRFLLCSREGSEITVKTVMDVGGGNGFLATQLAENLQCDALVVDPFTPKHAIDNTNFPHWMVNCRVRNRKERRFKLHRISSRLQDTNWETVPLDFGSCVLVAKHLCGTSIDLCLRYLFSINKLPPLLVLVPCCFNKGHYAEYCNPVYLASAADIHDEIAWNHCTRLTDWNRSCHQQRVQPNTSSLAPKLYGDGCRCTSINEAHCTRVRKKWTVEHFLPCMDDVASLVESVINYGRILWLREFGYSTSVVEYVPRCVTPKNRAIVAIRSV
uniref:tRNA:m(4)X modification enzyme TRM13 n=1 Tax=Trypanosoma congolense (strain IL3000) TaxID=1068625 RepID=G0V0G1_TRYCI|nr:conserved hypothetical protein [Trypanosoma congolense IL3000]